MYLKRIKGVYHFRKVTPSYLKNLILKSEISRSFKTGDREQARKLALRLGKVLDAIETDYRYQLIADDEARRRLLEIGIVSEQTEQVEQAEAESEKSDLGLLFEKFCNQQMELGKWRLKTRIEYVSSFQLFQRYCGEVGMREVTHRGLLEYRAVLMKLPPNLSKFEHLRGKKLCEICQMQHESRLSDRQINKYLVFLTNYFKWLTTHEYIEKNPAHNLLLPKNGQADEERNAYSHDEIELLIKTLMTRQKEFAHRPERIWVPLIAVYSGLRLGEICQLHVEDVSDSGGILCFDINQEGDRRVKNSASLRRVPVHKKLVDLGLLNYIQTLNINRSKLLFPLMTHHPVHGFGYLLGRWFSTFNRKYITQDTKKTFHSIRHSVANELKQLQMPGEVISELLGHKVESITMNRYGKRYRPDILLEAIERLPW